MLPADKYTGNDCSEDQHEGQRGLPELGTVSGVVLNSMVTLPVIHMPGIVFSLWELEHPRYQSQSEMSVAFHLEP